jgi:tetratricopeptide (TPR) repeat protein/predicted Ser/Thr protein kinase
MDDHGSRPDKKPPARKPASPGVRAPFAGESSSSNAPVPPLDKRANADSSPAEVDSDATIVDATPWESDPEATLVNAAPLGDPEATLVDSDPLSRPRPPARRSSAPSSKIKTPAGDSAAVFQLGEVVAGRYEILQLLGEGGMGAVYKAADRALDRFVALKVIRPEMASNPAILARFKQELLLSHQVTHRNVIRIYDLGESDDVMFITMEYIEGKDLRSLIREREKFTPEEAVEVIQQVCQALDAAHSVGIIHRDLKPQNIMQDPSGRILVMDFGLARTFQGDGMTQTGAIVGTMEYMSPEQALGKDLDQRSDIFALGLILFELLTGKTPFHADSALASLIKRTQERAVSVSEIDAKIPGALTSIVGKCLERDLNARYQSAAAILADLNTWKDKRAAGTIKFDAAVTPLGRTFPWPFIAGGLTVVILAMAGLLAVPSVRNRILGGGAKSGGPHQPVTVLVADFANHTGDSVLDDTLEPMINVALEGASFVNAYSRGDARKLAKKLPNSTDKLDVQSARLVAVDQGVNAVVTGDINKRGDKYDISATALDPVSGKVLAKSDVTVGNKQDILQDLPKLVAPIRKALGDTTPPSVQFDAVSGGFNASSLEAVQQDALGVEEQFAGKFQEAFDSFHKAAELDPKFARAYSGMAAMAQNLGRSKDAVEYMKLAMEHVDRMTERERYRNRGLYYLTTGDWNNCVQEYTQLVTHYPADRVGQNNLATCYTQLRNAPKALEAAQQAVQIVPKGVGQRLNLSFISSFAGEFAAGEKEARTALEMNPKAAQGYLVLAEALLGQGQPDKAADAYHQLEKFGPLGASTAAVGLGDLAAYQGKFAEAAHILEQGATADVAAKMTDNAASKYAALGNIEEMQGHHAAALADIGKALANSQSIQIKFLAASTCVSAGDIPKAQKLAASLSSEATSEPQAYGKIIEGMMALKKKDAKEAIKQLTAANSLLDTWIGRFELGRAYLEAGMFTEADSEFDQCTKRRGEAIELFMDNTPTYSYFPPVYYYQGRVREGMKSEGFPDFYKNYLSIRGQSSEDPLIADIHRRIGQ